MKKYSTILAATILGLFLSATFSFSAETPKRKILVVETSETKVTFTVRGDLPPVSYCATKQFDIFPDHPQFNMLSAALLTAAAGRKNVVVSYDDTVQTCPVEVISLKTY